jgi:hypothetical protein
MCYQEDKTTIRREQLEALLDKIVKEGTEEEVSALRGYLEWMVAQVEGRVSSLT